jgi:hypothetical protein
MGTPNKDTYVGIYPLARGATPMKINVETTASLAGLCDTSGNQALEHRI